MLVHVVKAFASTAPLIAASSTLKQQQRQQQRTAREREMKKRNEREVRADVEKNFLTFKALCSTECLASESQFCICDGAMSSADHIQRAAPNSPNRRPQLTLNEVCLVAPCSTASS